MVTKPDSMVKQEVNEIEFEEANSPSSTSDNAVPRRNRPGTSAKVKKII
jgi:hypothetical protein